MVREVSGRKSRVGNDNTQTSGRLSQGSLPGVLTAANRAENTPQSPLSPRRVTEEYCGLNSCKNRAREGKI